MKGRKNESIKYSSFAEKYAQKKITPRHDESVSM